MFHFLIHICEHRMTCGFLKKIAKVNRYIELCKRSPGFRIHSLELHISFPRFKQFVLSDCISFTRIRQSVLSVLSDCNSCQNRGNELPVRENGLSNSREGITNPWNELRITEEKIAQFDIKIYLWLFFKKISMSLQGFR